MNRHMFVKLIKIAAGDDEAAAIDRALGDIHLNDQGIEILVRVAAKHLDTVRRELEDADWPT